MYWWSGETTVKSAADTTGVSQKTIVQLYQYMRDVCSTKLLNTSPMIQRRKIQWKNWQEVNPWRLKLSTT
jgi:hypothetical protein